MTIKKAVTDKVIDANKARASKSTGPRTGVGKRRSQMNSLKHSFFAKELQLSEEDRPEFEVLRDSLLQQFAPATPMQQIAFEKIPCCCWRCKIALRMESRIVALQLNSKKEEPKAEAAGGEDTIRMEQWYGADYRSLQQWLRFLRELRADVADCGLLHLEQDGPRKESVIKGFGPNFYHRLMEWESMSTPAILAAEQFAAMNDAFGWKSDVADLPRRDSGLPETRRSCLIRGCSGEWS